MNKPKVIALKNLPMRPPITSTIAWFLLLDKFHAPGWLWGVMGTFFAFAWLVTVVVIWAQCPTELSELRAKP